MVDEAAATGDCQPDGDADQAPGHHHREQRLQRSGERARRGGIRRGSVGFHHPMVVDRPGGIRCGPMTHSRPAETRSFHQLSWTDSLADHVAEAAADWFAEDLGHECDWTSVSLIPADDFSELDVVVREQGVIAGLEAAAVVARVAGTGLAWQATVADGSRVTPGTVVATLTGPTQSVLAAERVILNLVGRMSGVAWATRQLVDAVRGTSCQIYDTRKTVPGWRLLDKFAVRLGGGCNHRLGLYDAILIKDNHLAALADFAIGPDEAVRRARAFVEKAFPPGRAAAMVVEVELDDLQQFADVLAAEPDVILLDNMPPEMLAKAVAERNRIGSATILEASGGVHLDSVAAIARTGIDRISTGWPTHHAPWLDVALDW
jgi:nicotinate-nucleotide pyrophosphorylase (carboxylating)